MGTASLAELLVGSEQGFRIVADGDTCLVRLLDYHRSEATSRAHDVACSSTVALTSQRGERLPRVSADEREVVIENPFGAQRTVLLAIRSSEVLLTTSSKRLLTLCNPELDLEVLLDDVRDVPGYSNRTIWRDVLMLPAGARALIRAKRGKIEVTVSTRALPEKTSRDVCIAETLEDTIEGVAPDSTPVVVRLSGGVDSGSILLAAAARVGTERIVAVTWCDERGAAHEDLRSATRLTERLKVQHEIISIDPACLLSCTRGDVLPVVSTSLGFRGFLDQESRVLAERLGTTSFTIFDGHGGDHLFLDPVPRWVLRDAVRNGGVRFGWRKAHDLASLYCEPLSRLAWAAIVPTAMRRKHDRNHLLARSARHVPASDRTQKNGSRISRARTSAKEHHYWLIWQAVYHNSLTTAPFGLDAVSSVHPFTQERMLGACAHFDIFELFDSKVTRRPFKNAIVGRYGEGAVVRSDKGHVTGAFQRALGIKKREITELISGGVLANAGMLDESAISSELKRTAYGVMGFSDALLRVICAELLVKSLGIHGAV